MKAINKAVSVNLNQAATKDQVVGDGEILERTPSAPQAAKPESCESCADLAEEFLHDPPEGEQAANCWEFYVTTGHFPVHKNGTFTKHEQVEKMNAFPVHTERDELAEAARALVDADANWNSGDLENTPNNRKMLQRLMCELRRALAAQGGK
jgi:hypothetical protein